MKKRGRPKVGVAKSTTIAFRLYPRAKYLIFVLSRIEKIGFNQKLENLITSCLSDSLTVDEQNSLWDNDPANRFMLFTEKYPDLLGYEEKVLLEIIKKNISNSASLQEAWAKSLDVAEEQGLNVPSAFRM